MIELEYDEILSIEPMGVAETVDITVEDTHMFFCEGIYTHNSAIGAKVVDTDQMGGSIKKAQIGHFIMSIARPIEQKKENKATIAILKSRFGIDGVVYDNVIFNNGTLEIEVLQNQDGSDSIVYNTSHASDIDPEAKMQAIMKRMADSVK